MARLQAFYKDKVVADLVAKFGYKSAMEVPRLTKITLNMGVGEAIADKKVLENAVGDMQKIAGQKPVTTKARKSNAGFKIRDGYPIGCMVTLRGPRMFEFLDRLVTIALPRVRDFRGISGKSFDGQGNYNIDARDSDRFIADNPDMIILYAAGNEGVDGNGNGVYDAAAAAAAQQPPIYRRTQQRPQVAAAAAAP